MEKSLPSKIPEEIINQYSPLLKDIKPIEVLGKGGYGSVLMVEFPNKHRAALKIFNNTFDTNKDNEKLNKIKKETDDPVLNKLIKKLVVNNPKDRMEWKDYFNDPFFIFNDDDIQQNNECK